MQIVVKCAIGILLVYQAISPLRTSGFGLRHFYNKYLGIPVINLVPYYGTTDNKQLFTLIGQSVIYFLALK